MVIYQVKLQINSNIYSQFFDWLQTHVKQMLEFEGFIQANILKSENADSTECKMITVQYLLTDREALEEYFTKHALRMREEGLRLFKDNFSAEREIFEVWDTILK